MTLKSPDLCSIVLSLNEVFYILEIEHEVKEVRGRELKYLRIRKHKGHTSASCLCAQH